MFYLTFSSEITGHQAWFVNWFCSSSSYLHVYINAKKRSDTSSIKYSIKTTSRSATAVLHCTNIANIIKSHNQKILYENDEAANEKKCNCRNKNLCPLDGTCLTKNIIYEGTVTTTSGNARTYISMTEHEFKTRYNNHKLSFKDRKHSHDTVLSKHIWDLKDGNINYEIKWQHIIKRASAYKDNSQSDDRLELV